ncbi:MAG: DUF4230 domain-containing protein [Eubacterium sp.]|nr:DUF4230 domain-containing protein [Eubacterium sp.]
MKTEGRDFDEGREYRPSKRRGHGFTIFIVGVLIGVIVTLVLTSGLLSKEKSHRSANSVSSASADMEMDNPNSPFPVTVDFSKAVLDQAQREKLLTVYSQKASVPYEVTKEGLFNWDVFKQTKMMILHGQGTYQTDLSQISSDKITVNAAEKKIEIHLSAPELSVEYLPEETEFYDTSNGLLRFGEMELTPEMQTEIEKVSKEKLKEAIEDDPDNLENAKRFAKLSVEEILQPVVNAAVDSAVTEARKQNSQAYPEYYTVNVVVD